ncbi:prefoldin subunit beta [Candidatus Woesearchaeota archaeon]|jgi:prefoldin beta subunit|nr:prefoldin subunit beta [Candidatus Woesearchaeota archaeon]MBT4336035.1 prefoldin subunit beta [Candidatus Woesearchaeota archaeon]MBT4468986.1 prefoldin subunit beta [Candidatus Woesearchaeota archaeon]MBT6744695.1 prefoldin subunit beta [Candidatus Woesearchaeota archaeon]
MSEKVQQIQILQQNLQQLGMQKQQVQSQLIESESAIKELESTSQAYKIVGKIMIASNKEDLIKDLEEKKQTNEARLKTFIEQENTLKQNIESLQQEIVSEMKKDKEEN